MTQAGSVLPQAPPRSEPVSEPVVDPVGVPGARVTVQAGKRQLTLSNLDKPLHPDGFTKGDVTVDRTTERHAELKLDSRTGLST